MTPAVALMLAPLFPQLFPQLFPWDRANESPLGHHHLVAAYCFAWGLQLAYLAYLALKWRALGRPNPNP